MAGRCMHRAAAAEVELRYEMNSVVKRYCISCNELLPLGPARDDGEHAEAVAIEIRAAELADDLVESDRLCDWTFSAFGDDEERRGWSIAGCIVEHKDEP